jgi:predicted RNA polymerase sigma factor
LPATQGFALALRIVSGLAVKQVMRAVLVSKAAVEQRITRAKSRIAAADVPFEAPDATEQPSGSSRSLIYLVFNEGYSAADDTAPQRVVPWPCEEAIRLARLLLRLFPGRAEDPGADRPALVAACAPAGAIRCLRFHRAPGGSRMQSLEQSWPPAATADENCGALEYSPICEASI